MHLKNHASGNILFAILIAVVLIAALTAAITRSDSGSSNLSQEKASIASGQLAAFGLDLKRAAENMTRAGKSESQISFAHASLTGYGTPGASPSTEVFNIAGSGVTFVPPGNGVNDGSQWEFSGFSAAPGVGDPAVPDLMVVFPHLSETVCRAYNRKAGYSSAAAIPTDSGTCVYDPARRYSGTFATTTETINTMDTNSFRIPAHTACVVCADSTYNAYYVLLER